jgi:hypothetical protein
MLFTAEGTGHAYRAKGKLLGTTGHFVSAEFAGNHELFAVERSIEHRISIRDGETNVSVARYSEGGDRLDLLCHCAAPRLAPSDDI